MIGDSDANYTTIPAPDPSHERCECGHPRSDHTFSAGTGRWMCYRCEYPGGCTKFGRSYV